MMCLSSIPDPQLTPSQEGKRSFVDHYIQFLANEFSEYILLVKEFFAFDGKSDNAGEGVQRSNMLMVIMMMKMSLIRSQCIFSDITQNIQYRVVQDELDKIYQKIQIGELWNDDMVKRLQSVRQHLDILIAALKVK